MKKPLATALVLSLASVAPRAAELETTHFFGFTLGSDVNAVGEIEGEFETIGRFAKSGGSYTAAEPTLGLKFIPFTNFSVEPILGAAFLDIFAVPGFDDRVQSSFDSTTVEMRYRVLDRENGPFGLTIGFDPHWFRVDDVTGARVDGYGADFLVIADRELMKDRLFASFNVVGGPDAERSGAPGISPRQSFIGVSAAIAAQVQPGVLWGLEARYAGAFDGFAFGSVAGQALFFGPTFYAKFSDKVWMSAGWSVQAAGHATGQAGALDLANFERHQAVLRFGYNF